MTEELRKFAAEAAAYFTAAFVRGVPLTPMDAEPLKLALCVGDPVVIRREASYLFALVDYEEARASDDHSMTTSMEWAYAQGERG
jgi:hypothetical protein